MTIGLPCRQGHSRWTLVRSIGPPESSLAPSSSLALLVGLSVNRCIRSLNHDSTFLVTTRQRDTYVEQDMLYLDTTHLATSKPYILFILSQRFVSVLFYLITQRLPCRQLCPYSARGAGEKPTAQEFRPIQELGEI